MARSLGHDVDGSIELLGGWWDVDGWILGEEVVWNQGDIEHLDRHDWEVLNTWVVSEAERMPDDNVIISDVFVSGNGFGDTANFVRRLVGPDTAGVELLVSVLGDPVVVGGEGGSLSGNGAWLGVEHGGWSANDLVTNWLAGNRVDLVLVDNLEVSVGLNVRVQVARLFNGPANVLEASALWILLIPWDSLGFLNHDSVLVTVNSRINSHVEDVLMRSGQNTWGDNVTPLRLLAFVNQLGGNDTSGSQL